MTLDRSKLATRGTFLHERIAHPESGGTPTAEVTELYGVESLEPYDTEWEHPGGDRLPEWCEKLSALAEWLCESARAPRVATDDQPFGAVVGRMAEWAWEGISLSGLTEQARCDLTRHLIDRLVTLAGQPLHVDYHAYVGEDVLLSSDSSERYEEYVDELLAGRIEAVFETYAVMGRLLVERIEQWRANARRLCERARHDEAAIASLVGVEEVGRIRRIDPGSGDSHDGGQTVTIVSFEAGDVVYKPRSVRPEAALGSFLDQVTEGLDGVGPFRTPAVRERDGYGWMEHVTQGAFPSMESVGSYYEEAGALAWLLSVVRATDLHYENIIAARQSPAVVDAETVLSPEPPGSPDRMPDERVRGDEIQSGPLRSALVPYYTETARMNRSGMGMISPANEKAPTLQWEHLGTDAIDVSYDRAKIVPADNYPAVDGEPVAPWLFGGELIAGFERAQRATEAATETIRELLAETLSGIETRIVPRQSLLYGVTLATLTNPGYLRDGVTHELKLVETLLERWEDCTFSAATGLQRAVVTAERDAMLRRDLPRFTTPSDGTAVTVAGTLVGEDIQHRDGLSIALERLTDSTHSDAARQRGLFRASLTNTALGAPVREGDS